MKKVLWFQNNILILRCRKLIINLTKGDTTMTAKDIDRRTKNIIHLSDGSIKYDFNKFNSYIEAIYADYIDCPTDEQLKESISLCFADSLDQKVMFKKLKLQFLSALANTH